MPLSRPTEHWTCATCKSEIADGVTELVAKVRVRDHLRKTHGIKQPILAKRTLAALDVATRYLNSFEWTVDGVRLVQTVSGVRRAKGRIE